MAVKHTSRLVLILTFAVFLFLISVAAAAPVDEKDIPGDLLKWKPWVLHGMEERLCPPDYNNENAVRCMWPSRLRLYFNSTGGRFEQEWAVFSKGWASLPGGGDIWPEKVKSDSKDIPVTNRNQTPSIYLTPGKYRVSGKFKWTEMPEMIRIPPATGMVALSINNKIVDYPVLDKNGRLWLQKRVLSENREDRLSVKIFRLITDSIPLKMTTRLQVNVSGRSREIKLEKVLLNNSIPMSLKSPLPARIGDAGDLLIQARPGRWEINIITRFSGPVNKLGPVAGAFGREIWSFAPQNHLRMVKVEGVPSVEPGQTGMPPGWKQYSAYIIEPGATVRFREIRRGDPDPAPDRLNLYRNWWLDFDGKGFTVQDHITGVLSRTWRLAINPPARLGRVSVSGMDRLITAGEDDKKPGVELRQGKLNLTADSRYIKSTATIPAVGWDHDFDSLSGVLNLPPGWRLITGSGVDILPGTWVKRWTLLDFFLVLIIAAAVFKLRNLKWGIIALLTMVLIFHEPGAPRTIWLHILAATALIRVLPQGWFKRLVYIWGGGAVVILIVMTIPFMVSQIRTGIFPQLELRRAYATGSRVMEKAVMIDDEQVMEEADRTGPLSKSRSKIRKQYELKDKMGFSQVLRETDTYRKRKEIFTGDPDALIQTGPGIPTWKWKAVRMQWNGPVKRDQEIRLWLLSPFANLVLAFVRVILLAFMIVGVIEPRAMWQKISGKINSTAVIAVLMVLFAGGISGANAGDSLFPPPDLLKELQARLLEKPDCFPDCADFLRMDLKVMPESLRILLEVHAASRTAVPLPGNSRAWSPEEVYLDNSPLSELSKDSGGMLWALVPEGIHRIVLVGKSGPGNSMQIPLPLKPHYATYSANGWDVQGIHKDGRVESGIRITRIKKQSGERLPADSNNLPPFLHIERILRLGLTWQVETTITRLTPLGTPVAVSVPLLQGESVTTAGIHVEDGKALVNMDPESGRISWTSSLETAPEISLKAPETVPWTETWVLDASPIWHCELSGIPVIHHQDRQGDWSPTWKPWPGESVSIRITRPKAIPGQMITIDSAKLVLTPGLRSDKAWLALKVRASQGGQHEVILPEGADLQTVKINDKSQPIRQEGQKVVIPLQPGSQTINLEWNRESGSSMLIRGPDVKIGKEAVNAQVTFNMPRNRWILWTSGPTLGPAVLFWSYIFIIILIALGLGRVTITPLKTRHWLLLSLGLTQVPAFTAILIAGWFIVIGVRKDHHPPENAFLYNMAQIGLIIWTLVAMSGLYTAISRGLLGIPDMQISGNNSTQLYLNWSRDRIGFAMPQPWALSLPRLVYNILMLFWAMWLAFCLVKWLRWAWECFSSGGVLKKMKLKRAASFRGKKPEPGKQGH